MKKFYGLFFLIFVVIVSCSILSGCGGGKTLPDDSDQIADLRDQISALQVQAGALDALINSDFATCSPSGDTADPLVNKICNIAQASTVELRVELSSQLQSFIVALQSQIDAVANDAADSSANLALLQAEIANILSDIGTLQSQMTSANAAILALENLTASITGTLNGVMFAISIGEENLSAGPMYENLLKRVDSKRVNGYQEAIGPEVVLASNAITATSGSASVIVTSTAHGLTVGDVVFFTDVSAGRGLSGGHFARDLVVTSVTVNTFNVTINKTATGNGTLGGAAATYHKVVGRGMATLWKSDDASDSSVRITSLGSKRYNFIIRRKASDVSNDTAEICYSLSNNAATFATINAAPEGGNGTIACK